MSSPTPSLSSVDLWHSSVPPSPVLPSSSFPRVRNPVTTGDLSGRKVEKEENLFDAKIISSSSIVTFLAIAAIGVGLTFLSVHGIGAPYTKIGAYAVWAVEGLSIFAVFTASIVKACEKRSRRKVLLSDPGSPRSGSVSPSPQSSPETPGSSRISPSIEELFGTNGRRAEVLPDSPPLSYSRDNVPVFGVATPPLSRTASSGAALSREGEVSDEDLWDNLPPLPTTPDSSDDEGIS